MLGINTYGTTASGEQVSAIPQLRVSAMDSLIPGFNFVVTLGVFTFGFQSVMGLTINKRIDYITEGGVNDHKIMVGGPNEDTPTLMFKRGLLMRSDMKASQALRAVAAAIPHNAGRKAALLAAVESDPQAVLENGPALGIIRVYSRERTLKAMYSFLSLGTTGWRMDDLDASSSSILCEEFTVAHTGLVQHPLDPIPPILRTVSSAVSDVTTFQNATMVYDKVKEAQKRKDAANELQRKKDEEQELERKKREEERALKEEQERLAQLNKELENESNNETT